MGYKPPLYPSHPQSSLPDPTMARPSRREIHADDPTYLWKVILRTLALLFAFVGIGTIAWALAYQPIPSLAPSTSSSSSYSNDYSYDYYGVYDNDIFLLPWSFISLGLSVIWNIANIIVLFSRNRPIHPGANVGCDLVLWLSFAVTGSFATIGILDYLGPYPGDDFYEGYYGGGYGGTFSNGTTIACEGFSNCGAETSYYNALRHKGIVIAVGCAMQFIVLSVLHYLPLGITHKLTCRITRLLHFALFISACRYTHARRHNKSSIRAKAITAEATEIARKMIADLTTGPNVQLQPLLQQPQQPGMQQMGGQWPMAHNEQQHMQPYDTTGNIQSPIQQHNTTQQQQLAREQAVQRWRDSTSPPVIVAKSSSMAAGRSAERSPPEITVETPHSQRDSQVHPALREERDKDPISHV